MSSKDGAIDGRMYIPVRTELQVAPHEGPQGIRAADRGFRSDGARTLTMAVPESWTKDAKCLNDWKAFAGEDDVRSKKDAKQLCEGCPVIDQCLTTAMVEEGTVLPRERGGVRGGLTPAERYTLSQEGRRCSRGHSKAKYAREWPSGRPYCAKCEEELTKRRGERKIQCGECGLEMRLTSKSRHKRFCKGQREEED